jgi:type I restriction enzyme, S subunit
MNAAQLLALYDRVAEAPDAVARLRRFVLDLAVRGKLVERDARDEPVPIALRRAGAHGHSEEAFPLPASWAWTEVRCVAETRLGKMLDKAKNRGNPRLYLRNINVRWFDFDLLDVLQMPFEDTELAEFTLRRGDVLICEGGEPGRAAVWDERVDGIYFQKALHRVRFASLVDPHFFVLALKASANDGRLAESFTGTGIMHFTGRSLDSYRFPLPPLAEQRRIVAKVDDLMALCDRLEAARTAREGTRNRLTLSSLARLTAPDTDAEALRAHARFALDALPALTTRPDQIRTLRQTILDLAVCGKLVPQDASDEPARAELERVVKLKTEHNMRKPKKVAPIVDAEKWCSTPIGWQWTRWDQITNWITYGFTRPMEHVAQGVPIITGKNVNEGKIILETASLTPQQSFDALNEKDKPQPGDILITKDGSIGRTAIVEVKHLPFCINQSVAVMWLRSCHFDRRYLQLVLDAPQTQDALLAKTAGVAIKHVSITDLGRMVFPLPPLAEQHRIVEQVDALMALCDRLEAALTVADATRARLLEALLHEALAPAVGREMEAAE